MSSFILRFILEKLKLAFIIGSILGLIIYMSFNKEMLLDFGFGFLLGCVNFALLSIGTDLLISNRTRNVKLIHLLFFTLRYLFIAYVMIESIHSRNSNVFAMFGGLIVIKLSIIMGAFNEHFLRRGGVKWEK